MSSFTAEIQREIRKAIDTVIERRDFVGGKDVRLFEEEVAGYLGVKHAIGLNSGTDAFRIALATLNLEEGDEVILPTFCFASDAEAVVLEGGRPVFVDIEPKTLNVDLDKVEQEITKNTRAIIPAHMYGMPIEIDKLMKLARSNNIVVIEDACQAFGAIYKGKKAGSFGDFSGISFYPSKPLGSYGDAGLITTNNDESEELIRKYRNHGSKVKYYHDFVGYSSRLDTIQAAILRVRLKYFERILSDLKNLQEVYLELLKDVEELALPEKKPDVREGFTHFTVRSTKREELKNYLETKGISCGVYYPLSLHLQKAFEYLGYGNGDFPVSEKAQNEVLSLPFDIFTNEEIVVKTVKEIKSFFHGNRD